MSEFFAELKTRSRTLAGECETISHQRSSLAHQMEAMFEHLKTKQLAHLPSAQVTVQIFRVVVVGIPLSIFSIGSQTPLMIDSIDLNDVFSTFLLFSLLFAQLLLFFHHFILHFVAELMGRSTHSAQQQWRAKFV
jgi:hypothetical protein